MTIPPESTRYTARLPERASQPPRRPSDHPAEQRERAGDAGEVLPVPRVLEQRHAPVPQHHAEAERRGVQDAEPGHERARRHPEDRRARDGSRRPDPAPAHDRCRRARQSHHQAPERPRRREDPRRPPPERSAEQRNGHERDAARGQPGGAVDALGHRRPRGPLHVGRATEEAGGRACADDRPQNERHPDPASKGQGQVRDQRHQEPAEAHRARAEAVDQRRRRASSPPARRRTGSRSAGSPWRARRRSGARAGSRVRRRWSGAMRRRHRWRSWPRARGARSSVRPNWSVLSVPRRWLGPGCDSGDSLTAGRSGCRNAHRRGGGRDQRTDQYLIGSASR